MNRECLSISRGFVLFCFVLIKKCSKDCKAVVSRWELMELDCHTEFFVNYCGWGMVQLVWMKAWSNLGSKISGKQSPFCCQDQRTLVLPSTPFFKHLNIFLGGICNILTWIRNKNMGHTIKCLTPVQSPSPLTFQNVIFKEQKFN